MASPTVDRLAGVNNAAAYRGPVRVATTAAITLSGLQTIDGVALAADDRVLVKNQTDQTQNGVWVVSATAWSRAKDFNDGRDLKKGTQVFVTDGTANGNVQFIVTTANPIVIDTSNLTFTVGTVSAVLVAEAEAAQAAAEAAQAAAELAEAHAETAEANAETAEVNAELAETNAELAETNAELAEVNAELAEANAETAQAAAEAALASLGNVVTSASTIPNNALVAGDGGTRAVKSTGIVPSANVNTLLGAADFAAFRTSLSLVPGTNVQAFSAILAALAGLSPAANDVPYFTAASAMALVTSTTYGRALLALANQAALTALIAAATESLTGAVEKSTVAEVRSATADKFVASDLIETASAEVTLTDAATIAVDWDTFINGVVTLTANRALGNPTNGQPGTYRTIRVIGNDATDRTLTFGTQYEGDVPSLTLIDSTQQYLLTIRCITSTHFLVVSINATVA